MELRDMLQILAKQDGSDLYLSTGAPPCAKFNGALRPLNEMPLEPGEVARIAADLMDSEQKQQFEKELEMNLAISLPQIGRFRINIFKQRNEVSLVARNIKTEIPRFEDLKLPPVLLPVLLNGPIDDGTHCNQKQNSVCQSGENGRALQAVGKALRR